MECRRWADLAGLFGFSWYFVDNWIDGWDWCPRVHVGMRVSQLPGASTLLDLTTLRIVEYATREQAQHAVQTLSNQNLMGRLVYVREVSRLTRDAAQQLTRSPYHRIAKPSRASLLPPPSAAEATVECAVDSMAARTALVPALVLAVLEAVDASSTSPTYVVPTPRVLLTC